MSSNNIKTMTFKIRFYTMYAGEHDRNINIWRRRYSNGLREIAEKKKQWTWAKLCICSTSRLSVCYVYWQRYCRGNKIVKIIDWLTQTLSLKSFSCKKSRFSCKWLLMITVWLLFYHRLLTKTADISIGKQKIWGRIPREVRKCQKT